MKALILLGLCFAISTLNAQNESPPGRFQASGYVPALSPAGSAQSSLLSAQSLAVPLGNPQPLDGQPATAIAEALTPEIQALARNLANDPTRIFNYVHDHIRYVHYFGSKKGAALTLLERSGNDFDQCALLSALLTSAGYSPTYQFGLMKVPYDNSANHLDLHHLFGLSLLNTNWSNTLNYFAWFFGTRGNWIWIDEQDNNTIAFHRVWVVLTITNTTYYLDPSFKVSEPIAGTNLASAMSLNTGTLMSAAGGQDYGTYCTVLSEPNLRAALQTCNSNLLAFLSNNIPNASVQQVVGGQQIVPSSGLPLPTSLLYPTTSNGGQFPMLYWTYQPTNFMATFSMTLAGTNHFWYAPQLQGQRLSLTFSTNGTATLQQEDNNPILQTTNTGSGSVSVTMSTTYPYGGWDTTHNQPVDTLTNGVDTTMTASYQRTNSSYAIMYAYEASPQRLQARQQKLDAYLQQGLPNSSPQVVVETLNVMGLSWMVQTELAEELLAQQCNLLPQNHHRLGRMGQEAKHGYYVDVYMQLSGTFPNSGFNTPDKQSMNQGFDVSSYIGSAMEHAVIEQMQRSNLVAASTVKMLQIANTNNQAIYLASSANWTTGAHVRTNLVYYDSTTLSNLDWLIGNSYFLLLPQNGSNHVAGTGSWAGDGYVELVSTASSRFMGMVIGGNYNGGYVSDPNAGADTTTVSQTGDSQQNSTTPNPPATTVTVAGDPVNMADGTFQIYGTPDLSLGQADPRGITFFRYYSSELRNYNQAGMAYGWLHNYAAKLVPISAPQPSLGTTTPQQMAPMIVTTCAALNLYNNTNLSPKNWAVTALIAKWGVDQIISNAVTISMGKDTIQFIKQPDGSLTPPGGLSVSLTKNGSGYNLLQRHGNTYKFDNNNLLTNVVDQYGRGMKFTYNSSNWVSTITDWTNRTLNFVYSLSPSRLTSIYSSTGRTNSYGYTMNVNTQLDLTSVTDPEGKTSTFAYDANHQIITSSDPLNHLVVSNNFDAYGHVTTQYTQADTNKLWQIFASGFQTVVIDPASGQQQYSYDDKSRQTGYQDALGRFTQTFYDGQDHAVMTVSPLNETNRSYFDANNNMILSVDALNKTNQFVYDRNNNLVTTIDPLSNQNHFGYNAQFSLIGSTNGAGNWFTNGYNPDGTLQKRGDSAGATSYTYDGRGQLSGITYPNGLGSESFGVSGDGDVTNHTDARSVVTSYQYNLRRQLTNTVINSSASTNLTTKVAYDAVGNVLQTTDARTFNISNYWSPTRKLLSTTYPITTQGAPVVTNGFDNRDWLWKTVDPLQKATIFVSDVAGQTAWVADPLLRTNWFGYDADGRKVASTNFAQETTSQAWSPRSELLVATDPATHSVLRSYDDASNQIRLTNRNGKVWQFQYDGANRLKTTISPRNAQTSQLWNDRGLLQSVTDPATHIANFYYDALGRLTNRSDLVATTLRAYDGNNNLTSVTEGSKSNLWTYDAYNRVSIYTDADGNLIKYLWDANGNLTNLIYPGNRIVSYAYDTLNRVTNVTDWANGKTSLTYDLANHLTSITRPNGTVRLINYDADGEVTNIVEKTATGGPIAFFTLGWTNSGRTAWEFAGPLPHAYTPPNRTLTYDDDNRLSTFKGPTMGSAQNIGLDANGNMTSGPLTNDTFVAYNYDVRNRLTNASGVSYTYDPLGNRTWVTNGANVIHYVINPNAKLSQVLMRSSGSSTTYYIYGGGLLYEIRETSSSTNSFTYHFDVRGSTVAMTDMYGNVTDRIEYSAYGMTSWRGGTNDTPFLFNGRYGVMTDPNGLLFMRARYYNPYICRFINPDPSGFSGGLNFYAAFNGNPISMVDPSGMGAVGDNAATSWINNASGTPANLSDPFGVNNTSPWELGVQWLTGTGPRVQNFTDGDPMTVMLQQHSWVQQTRDLVANNVATGGDLQGYNNYSVGGLSGVPKYFGDYSTLLTGGLTGNLAVTYLGSYTLHYDVTSVDSQNGTATVNFQAYNASTIASATHPPVIGYTAWWNQHIATPLNNMFQTGPMSPTVQNFNWTETIPVPGHHP